MPEDSKYKKYTMSLVNQRLQIVKNVNLFSFKIKTNYLDFQHQEKDPEKIESKIACGQCEELLVQAENELSLSRRFLVEKPWEPLISKPPTNQWKWPI